MATIKKMVNGQKIRMVSPSHTQKLGLEPKYSLNRSARRTIKAKERLQPMADRKWRLEDQRIKERKLRQANIQARIEKRKNGNTSK